MPKRPRCGNTEAVQNWATVEEGQDDAETNGGSRRAQASMRVPHLMARIRSIHPGIFTDEAWVSCGPLTRLLFLAILTDADDQGVFEWKPLQIKMRLLPGDHCDIAAMLDEMAAVDLVKAFEVGGKKFGAIRMFRKHQRPKKPNAVHPLPSELRDYVSIDDEDDPADNLRKELHDEQNGACFYCETPISHYSKRADSLEVDHRIPTSKGGGDERENLVAACRACNRGKCDRSEAEWREILRSRVAKPSFANASSELAPQMEDGGGRMGKEDVISISLGRVRELAGDALADFSKTMAVASVHGLTGILTGERPCSLEDVEAGIVQAAAWYRGRHGPGSMRNYDLAVKLSAENRDKRLRGAPPVSERHHEPSSDHHRPASPNARQSRADASLDAAARVVDRRRAERASREGDGGHAAEPARLSNGGG